MKKQTELKTAKELWKQNEKIGLQFAFIYKGRISQHLQTCERWFEFLKGWFNKELKESDAYLNDKKEIRTTYDDELVECKLWDNIIDKIKDLEQTIKYHKSKLGENGK